MAKTQALHSSIPRQLYLHRFASDGQAFLSLPSTLAADKQNDYSTPHRVDEPYRILRHPLVISLGASRSLSPSLIRPDMIATNLQSSTI